MDDLARGCGASREIWRPASMGVDGRIAHALPQHANVILQGRLVFDWAPF